MDGNLKWRAPNYGNGITEGICSSIFPVSSLLVSSTDEKGGQSTGENV
ncbi:MAG: hypothetical protein WA941_00350 [Nitrososphaeraceae archaeon]